MIRTQQFWWARWVPGVLLLLACGFVAIRIGPSLLVPVVLSFAIAVVLEPLVARFQRRNFSRTGAVLLSLATAQISILLLLLFLVPGVWTQLGESFEKLPFALVALMQRGTLLMDWMQEHLSPALFSRLGKELELFGTDPTALRSHIGGWLSRGAFGLVDAGSAVLGLIAIPFFVYYLLLDMVRLRELAEAHIPPRHRAAGSQLLDEIGEVVVGYIRGRCLLAVAMAAFYGVGLLVLQVPLWAALSLIAGILGIVPYLGALSGFFLALGFAALDGATPLRLAGVAVLFGGAQIVEDYVLTPRLIGRKLELHPMVVLLALIVGGDLLGLLGLLLAIPALAVMRVLVRFLDRLYQQTEFFSREPDSGALAAVVESSSAEVVPAPAPLPPTEHEPPCAVPSLAEEFHRLRLADVLAIANKAISEWTADNGPRLAASVAFYTLLSLAPLVVVIVAVAGLAYGPTAAHGQLAWQIQDLVGPEGARAIQAVVQGAYKPGTGAIAVCLGIATLMLGASSVVVELRDALNTIWRVRSDDEGISLASMIRLVRERFYSFALVLGVGFLLLGSLVLNTWIAMLGEYFDPSLSVPEYVLQITAFLVSFLVTTILFAAIYRVLPDVQIKWNDVAVGASVTSLLFTAGKQIIGLYLGKAGLGSAYGAAGSLVVVLVWVYYSAQLFFLGAEFTKVYAKTRGSHAGGVLPPPPTDPRL